MKKALKTRSKRLSTRDRVKQEKKKREYDRKIRKDKKRHPEKYRKSKKDPGVPNLCPFKEEVLHEAREAVEAKEREKGNRREAIKAQRALEKSRLIEERRTKGYEGLVKDAQDKLEKYEANKSVSGSLSLSDRSAKAFYKEFERVMETADVILQVLDARDPLGTRSRELEESIINSTLKKRLVFVLNKADLVPKDNLEAWIKYLRKSFPTIAFKSSTQSQADRLGRLRKTLANSTEKDLQTSKCVGADTLMLLLGNYCRNKDVKMSIRVGVVGFPNVGKSSLINSLKRSKACNVGSTPGVTKVVQEMYLNSKIKLLDSPGMILASGPMSDAGVALRNAIKIETLDDPITPVEAILHRCDKRQIALQYRIPLYEDVTEFLNLVAKHMGKLKRGGIPERESAARIVLQDWNTGKIKYYTHPPEQNASNETHISAEIVSEFSKEFSLDDALFDKMETDDFDKLPSVLNSETMAIQSQGIIAETLKPVDEMEQDENVVSNNLLPSKISVVSSTASLKLNDEKVTEPRFVAESGVKLKKMAKLREKKLKKDRNRRDKVATDLAEGMEAAFETINDEDYDFKSDFK